MQWHTPRLDARVRLSPLAWPLRPTPCPSTSPSSAGPCKLVFVRSASATTALDRSALRRSAPHRLAPRRAAPKKLHWAKSRPCRSTFDKSTPWSCAPVRSASVSSAPASTALERSACDRSAPKKSAFERSALRKFVPRKTDPVKSWARRLTPTTVAACIQPHVDRPAAPRGSGAGARAVTGPPRATAGAMARASAKESGGVGIGRRAGQASEGAGGCCRQSTGRETVNGRAQSHGRCSSRGRAA